MQNCIYLPAKSRVSTPKPRPKSVSKKQRPDSAPCRTARPDEARNYCHQCWIPIFHGKVSVEVEMAKLDRVIRRLMMKQNVPGAQLAVAKAGQLKFWKGYGVADKESGEPLTPWHVLRISSLSKIITGTAVLKLVEERRLRLQDKPFLLLDGLEPPLNAHVDPRLPDITVQHLLQHAAGWNSAASTMEPTLMPGALMVSCALGVSPPPSCYDIIRFMKGQPLDYTPGTSSHYSNFGFNVLGRVIERVTGMKYEDYVQQELFKPLGLRSMRMGETRRDRSGPGEVQYYGANGKCSDALSVYPGAGYVQTDYGFADLRRSADSCAGWVGNARDVACFTVHMDGLRKPAILGPQMLDALFGSPKLGGQKEKIPYCDMPRGMIWFMNLDEKGNVDTFQHAGSVPGSHSFCIRLAKENIMVYLLNTLPEKLASFVVDTADELVEAARSIQLWPDYDLFDLPEEGAVHQS